MMHKTKKSLGLKISGISPETFFKKKKSLGLKNSGISPETFFKKKKSLGQNFLKSQKALNAICVASGLNSDDVVLEIGPGKGALTTKLLERAGQVIAVEKDFELISILQEKFANEIKNEKLILVNDDILKFDFCSLPLPRGGLGTGELKDPLAIRALPLSRGREIPSYKIIANIPYNITGAILKKFLSSDTKPSTMSLLVQKEVAERIVARDKKESILSLSVKAYGDASYIMKVEKRFFSPSPKVDSAIILIKNIGTNNFKSKKEEELFFQIIKAGFLHKRKILKKNLENFFKNENYKEVRLPYIEEIWKKLNLNPKIRAENVPLQIWLDITNYFSENL